MADSEEPKAGPCTFLFKKSTKKFSGRKRKASDSDKGTNYLFDLWYFVMIYKAGIRCGVVFFQRSWNVKHKLAHSQVTGKCLCSFIPVFNNDWHLPELNALPTTERGEQLCSLTVNMLWKCSSLLKTVPSVVLRSISLGIWRGTAVACIFFRCPLTAYKLDVV